MSAMLQFATLVAATMFAVAGAVALNWLFLRGAFLMMRPATAKRLAARPRADLVRGTRALARAYAPRG
jgi:hypothetical protein